MPVVDAKRMRRERDEDEVEEARLQDSEASKVMVLMTGPVSGAKHSPAGVAFRIQAMSPNVRKELRLQNLLPLISEVDGDSCWLPTSS